MEQLADAVLTRLDKLGFKASKLAIIRTAILEECENYDISPKVGQLVPNDYLQPAGYKNFMVFKKAEGLSDKTLNQYQCILERFFRSTLKPLESVTSTHIQMYLLKLTTLENNSARSANNHRHIIGSLFSWLHKMGYIASNPMVAVPPIKEKKKVYDAITPEQFESIFKGCDNQRDRAILTVIAGSGIRVGELCGMTLERLNIQEGTFTVTGKGNKDRVCFLTPRAKAELRAYLKERDDDCPYVFCSRIKPFRPLKEHSVQCVFRELSDRIGYRVFPHKLRHYFADEAHAAGIDVLDISRMLGHTSVDTTQIYLTERTADLALKHSTLR